MLDRGDALQDTEQEPQPHIIVDPAMAPFLGPEGYDQPAAEVKISALHTAIQAAGLDATWGGRYCESILVRVG